MRAAVLILFTLLFAFIFRTAVGHPMWIMTRGMVPTLFDGDLVWVSSKTPVLGDVVKVHFDTDPGVYRVVGTEGQEVEIANGRLFVDGVPLQGADIQLVSAPGADCSTHQVPASIVALNGRRFHVVPGGEQPLTRVPRGHVYVLGDHRGVAGDSRPWGAIRIDQVAGVVTTIIWSWGSCETSPRWQRIGNLIE